MNANTHGTCLSSWAVSKAEVGSVILCPTCERPVRLKLMGASKFPGRYVGVPKHATPEQHVAATNARTNAAMTSKEKKASDNVLISLSSVSAPTRWDVFYLGERVAESIEARTSERACADYLRFSDEIGGRVKLDWLTARPAAADEFKEINP